MDVANVVRSLLCRLRPSHRGVCAQRASGVHPGTSFLFIRCILLRRCGAVRCPSDLLALLDVLPYSVHVPS